VIFLTEVLDIVMLFYDEIRSDYMLEATSRHEDVWHVKSRIQYEINLYATQYQACMSLVIKLFLKFSINF